MQHSAYAFYRAIQKVCAQGYAVVLYSSRCGGRRHTIRTLGPMNPDGITVQYSSEPDARLFLSRCVLLSTDWILVIKEP